MRQYHIRNCNSKLLFCYIHRHNFEYSRYRTRIIAFTFYGNRRCLLCIGCVICPYIILITDGIIRLFLQFSASVIDAYFRFQCFARIGLILNSRYPETFRYHTVFRLILFRYLFCFRQIRFCHNKFPLCPQYRITSHRLCKII